MKKILVISLLILFSASTAMALDTYYDNQVGYNNKIPYSAFFNGHGPRQQEIKVQGNVDGQRFQGVIEVNTPEEKVEQQKVED